jgi:hypothetical protein
MWAFTQFASVFNQEEKEDRHKNLLSFNNEYDIDCPGDLLKYRASMGHKANHNFDDNVMFCFVKSPRSETALEVLLFVKKQQFFLNYFKKYYLQCMQIFMFKTSRD